MAWRYKILEEMNMTEPKKNLISDKKMSAFLIANAIARGAVIIGTALVLRGSGYMDKLLPILGGGAGFSIVIMGGSLLEKK
jgi:hypothetical protein